MRTTIGFWCGVVLLSAASARGMAPPDTTPFSGQVTALRAFRDAAGRIRTEVTLTGTDAATRRLTIDGGEINGAGIRNGDSPRFVLGQKGRLAFAPDTGLPVWTPDAGGITPLAGSLAGGDPRPYDIYTWYDSRFTTCDRGDPILYRVDTNALPTGIAPARALTAVSNAVQAWAAVSSVRFQFDGTQVFGAAAPNLSNKDYRIWIQLYNYGNYIASGGTLGLGGYGYTVYPGDGGQIGGSNYYPSTWGYVIICHTNSFFSNNPTNLEEVLAHEVGHVLSLDHDPGTNSIMYPTVSGNGRGARLGTNDISHIRAMYPSNTPPYGVDRIMHVLTRSTTQITPHLGTNAVAMTAYDLQTTNLTIVYDSSTAGNGAFSTNGNTLGYTPSAYYGYVAYDPAASSNLDYYIYRVSDGTNLSPFVTVRVMAFFPDADNDYLPDYWETLYPTVHASGATGDPDTDGFSNYQEWLLGTVPTNKASCLDIPAFGSTNLTWIAKPYEPYEVQASTNLAAGFTLYKPVVPTNASGNAAISWANASNRFFRVRRIY